MAQLLNTARMFVLAISLFAIVGAPFAIMNSENGDETSGYGIQYELQDRAKLAVVAANV